MPIHPIATVEDSDPLLREEEVADWLRVTSDWLRKGRCDGFGPKAISLTSRMPRYRRSDVAAWLAQRSNGGGGT